ncbi:TatD family hydrolase [Paenibacillus macerans]|uniref:TatD family hydrolase n=1 Tax=Paenibacillus macerans TaxID=44252 RepID=UPI00203AC6E5|nr:TatD family hydrolase [Paenibacillus macerans]MCM3697882.1 TatD family hydrolase [Paenibacillus macerans]
MTYFDFHVHIDHYPNPNKLAKEYESNKIYALFVTNLPELFEKQYLSYQGFKYVRLALGYHPDLTDEFPLNQDLFDKLVSKTSYIGEVGIDISGNQSTNLHKQIENFSFVTQRKYNKDKIYSIHSRGAEDEVLNILIENDVKYAVFHWYTGNISTLERIAERKYMFSVNINMLLSKKGQNIIKKIPQELLLFETDGPFTRFEKKVIRPAQIPSLFKMFDDQFSNFTEVSYKNFRRMLLLRELQSKIRT